MSNEFITTPVPEKVAGFKGLSDAAHFDRLRKALLGARENALFDRAAADRVLDDLRYVAYRRGRLAAEVFLFLDQEIIDADEELSMAQDDLNGMSRNLPFLRETAAVVEQIESIREEMSEEAQIFFGWRPYSGRWAFPNPVWSELRTAFQEGRDDVESAQTSTCPVFSC